MVDGTAVVGGASEGRAVVGGTAVVGGASEGRALVSRTAVVGLGSSHFGWNLWLVVITCT